MNVLLVAATETELSWMGKLRCPEGVTIANVITGIGMVNCGVKTAVALSSGSYDLAIQIGIAGTLSPKLPVGEAVCIRAETLPEMGVVESGIFKSIFEMGLCNQNEFPYTGGCLLNPNENLLSLVPCPAVLAGTVSEISTLTDKITKYSDLGIEIESMEGAAFHRACLEAQVPFLQIRGISNIVGDRNKQNWQFHQPMGKVRCLLEDLLQKKYQRLRGDHK